MFQLIKQSNRYESQFARGLEGAGLGEPGVAVVVAAAAPSLQKAAGKLDSQLTLKTCSHTEGSCWTPSSFLPSIELQVRNPLQDRVYHSGQLHKSYKIHGQHPKQQPLAGPQAGLATFLLGAVTGCGCFAGGGERKHNGTLQEQTLNTLEDDTDFSRFPLPHRFM